MSFCIFKLFSLKEKEKERMKKFNYFLLAGATSLMLFGCSSDNKGMPKAENTTAVVDTQETKQEEAQFEKQVAEAVQEAPEYALTLTEEEESMTSEAEEVAPAPAEEPVVESAPALPPGAPINP
jgi:hypothetical protein